MVKLLDPREGLPSGPTRVTASEIAGVGIKPAPEALLVNHTEEERKLRSDFRYFLIALWRHLLGVDPADVMLDLASALQHGPERDCILAFRGFSKSWITGAYALWLLWNNPQLKVLVESGSLARAVATTNWCLQIILSWPLLAGLKPLPHQRQSSKAFDVGPATPEQSPSFHALGIGGQVVGFRADVIIGDDVETQQNSLTVTMRDKNLEAIKEFDSVIKPGGTIKFLGTPHDEDSMYSKLPAKGYNVRIYPALFPTAEQMKGYGVKLAPWVTKQMAKLGPSCVGRSIMPTRFTDADLAKRRLSLGNSEFALQFMLDTSLSDRDKYPLKVKDLMVASLDNRRGPEQVTWSEDAKNRVMDLQVLGFEGDFYHQALLPPSPVYSAYNRIVGAIDSSGRGTDETAMVILAELNGILFWLYLWASKSGYSIETLTHIARACVTYRVHKLIVEDNFGDGMFRTLLEPVMRVAWANANRVAKKKSTLSAGAPAESLDDGGTEIVGVRASSTMSKEKRILSVLEPVTQQHRLVVDRRVIEWDYNSLSQIEGEDTRHRYSCMHQFTHLTKERESLTKDDRLDALGTGIADFADILGVDPGTISGERSEERTEDELEKLFGELEEDDEGIMAGAGGDGRAECLKPQAR